MMMPDGSLCDRPRLDVACPVCAEHMLAVQLGTQTPVSLALIDAQPTTPAQIPQSQLPEPERGRLRKLLSPIEKHPDRAIALTALALQLIEFLVDRLMPRMPYTINPPPPPGRWRKLRKALIIQYQIKEHGRPPYDWERLLYVIEKSRPDMTAELGEWFSAHAVQFKAEQSRLRCPLPPPLRVITVSAESIPAVSEALRSRTIGPAAVVSALAEEPGWKILHIQTAADHPLFADASRGPWRIDHSPDVPDGSALVILKPDDFQEEQWLLHYRKQLRPEKKPNGDQLELNWPEDEDNDPA